MKTIIILFISFYGMVGFSQSHLYKTSNETQLALKGYEQIKEARNHELVQAKIEENQRPFLDTNIEKYYHSLLSINADFNNEKIDRDEMRKQRNFAYYNYQEGVRAILSKPQFELYQTNNGNGCYCKRDEKSLIKYLKKYGYIK